VPERLGGLRDGCQPRLGAYARSGDEPEPTRLLRRIHHGDNRARDRTVRSITQFEDLFSGNNLWNNSG
jgi:hypothetical protein